MFAALAAQGYAAPQQNATTVHPERATQIAQINAKATTWRAAAHPRFAADAPGASKHLLGAKGNWGAQIRDLIKTGEVEVYQPSVLTAATTIPTAFDSATAFPCARLAP